MNAENGWAHPYPSTCCEPDERCVSEDFLDTMLPYGNPLIQVVENDERHVVEGFFIASECKRWVLHDNLQQALKVFMLWTVRGFERRTVLGAILWKPLIIANGNILKISSGSFTPTLEIDRGLETLWPDTWDVWFTPESHKGHDWRIGGVLPPPYDEQDVPFQLKDISVP